MVTLQPQAHPAGRYTVNETCKLLGIHRNTLRKYTEAGEIRCDIRKGTWQKFYTGLEILRFWNAVL